MGLWKCFLWLKGKSKILLEDKSLCIILYHSLHRFWVSFKNKAFSGILFVLRFLLIYFPITFQIFLSSCILLKRAETNKTLEYGSLFVCVHKEILSQCTYAYIHQVYFSWLFVPMFACLSVQIGACIFIRGEG